MMSTSSKTPGRVVRTLLLVAAMAVTALAPSTGSAGSECDAKSLKHPKVAAACTAGGKKAINAMMKKLVKDQNAAGNAITCESCHKDLKTFARKDNAEADLKKYLK
jgi:hypothetical protein